MKNFSKSAILPIVSALCLTIGYVTGHKINPSVVDQIATFASAAIFLGFSVYGIFKNHTKQTIQTVVSETEQVAQAVVDAAKQVEGEQK